MVKIYAVLVVLLFLSCNKTENRNETIIKPIGKGKITTIADGYDVKRVNLWSSVSSERKIIAYMTNGEEVLILKDADPYYLVESANKDGRKGYCMKGFIILSE